MSILIERPGIFTTVQDLGRHGYRRFGINPAGVMDPAAARLINAILGNDDDGAVLETHFPGPTIIFEEETTAALGGADLLPQLDDAPLPTWQVFNVKQGSTLKFTGKRQGHRCYLAVKGGFDLQPWLGSLSTNLFAGRGGFLGRRLESGDRIKVNRRNMPTPVLMHRQISPWVIPPYSDSPTIRILPGAEFEGLTNESREKFFNQEFTISTTSDRMGFRLEGEPIEMSDRQELVSAAVGHGTVQALPDDQLIVLLADHQTTGGYPRLAHVISRDLPLIGQLGPGDKFTFQMTTVEEAEQLKLEFERNLKFLRAGSKFDSVPN